MPEFNPTQLQQIYEQRFEQVAIDRQRVWEILTSNYFQRYIPDDATTLDLGTGWGEFIRNIKSKTKYAMDINPDSRFKADPSVQVLLQDCSKPWALPDECLDVIFTSNFFEHLHDKEQILETLVQAKRCLKPGGKILCLGPNIKYIGRAYWDFWDHHIALSDQALVEALALVNLKPVLNIPRFLPYTMSGKKAPASILIKLYLKLPFAWPIFGKQFFIIATKP